MAVGGLAVLALLIYLVSEVMPRWLARRRARREARRHLRLHL
jgi:hypothetical protein